MILIGYFIFQCFSEIYQYVIKSQLNNFNYTNNILTLSINIVSNYHVLIKFLIFLRKANQSMLTYYCTDKILSWKKFSLVKSKYLKCKIRRSWSFYIYGAVTVVMDCIFSCGKDSAVISCRSVVTLQLWRSCQHHFPFSL